MKNYFVLLIAILLYQFSFAQDSALIAPVARYHVSLITCGTGDELYALYGHSAIRVKDRESGQDVVYNYGTFNYDDPDFYKNYVLGQLNYWLSKEDYDRFVNSYKRENRSVRETVLHLDDHEAEKLSVRLEKNLQPENKVYLYDFLYANCATKIRDVFETIDPAFPVEYGLILKGEKITYRQIINQYMVNAHWPRLGVNLLLGSPVDSTMSEFASMFLPDLLEEGVRYARFKNKDFAAETVTIFESEQGEGSFTGFNAPFWLSLCILILVVLSYHIRILGFLKPVLNFLILLITGLLGLLMLFMWLGTDHQSCNNNWNILWALPANVVVAFIAHKKKVWFKIYALAAISCMIVALIIHVAGLQLLPLTEILPLFGCLLYIYMHMYYQAIFKQAEQRREEIASAGE